MEGGGGEYCFFTVHPVLQEKRVGGRTNTVSLRCMAVHPVCPARESGDMVSNESSTYLQIHGMLLVALSIRLDRHRSGRGVHGLRRPALLY